MGFRLSAANTGEFEFRPVRASPTCHIEIRCPSILATFLLVTFLLLGSVAPTSVTAAASGTFRPPHSDLGVDTNGDGRYNFLRIQVRLAVTNPGTFTVHVVLKDDLDLGLLSERSVTVALPSGDQSLPVDLSGVDVYNGGVDGPYNAHLTLRSDFGTVLATDAHVTSAYHFTDFQPYDARIVPPHSERTLDNDTDGLADWLELGFTLDVSTQARYTLESLLTDQTYTVSLRWSQTVELAPGRVGLDQLFLGYPVRLAAKNGPYLVTTGLYNDLNQLIDFLYVETRAYAYTAFETPPVRLESPHHDSGVDAGTDGLYDVLRVDVGLRADVTGTYTLRGVLVSGSGYPIAASTALLALAPGPARASLEFPGSAIYDAGVDGPYRVDLELYDTSIRRLDSGSYSTAAYAALDFQPRVLYLDPPHEDRGVDPDGDGKFDALEVVVHANVTSAATVRIVASLRQGVLAPDLVRVSVNVSVVPGLRSIPVSFLGPDIVDAGVEGPYRVWIEVYGSDGAFLDKDSHRTQAYALSEFEAARPIAIQALVSDRGEDVDADGAINRLRVTVALNVTVSGTYRFEGTLSRGTQPIATSAKVDEVGLGRADVGLVFAGPEIRSSGTDGPYDLGLTVRSMDGRTVASAVMTTSAYLAASFEPAAPSELAGEVRSAWTGLPLAGARAWLADYGNHVFRETTTDANGRYALSAYEGSYVLIIDHPDAQAQSISTNLSGSAWHNATLGRAVRTIVRDTLTWGGWDSLLMSIRYQYGRDAPSLRYDLDWQGNRDGWVQAWEEASLADPVDRLQDAIDARTTAGRVMANFASYAAVGETFLRDTVVGDVTSTAIPVREVILAFRSESAIGIPPRLYLVFEVYYDTVDVDRSLLLYLPGQFRYVSSNETGDVLVRARRYVNPLYVDPFGTLEAPEPPSIVFLGLMFYTQTSYVPGTPSAPTGLLVSSNGTVAELTWIRPAYDTDGVRLRNLAGYYVYRAPDVSGSFSRLGGLVPGESFRDPSSSASAVYRVTAVNTDGRESAISETAGSVPGSSGDPTGRLDTWRDARDPDGTASPGSPYLALGTVLAATLGGCLLGVAAIRRSRRSRRGGSHK